MIYVQVNLVITPGALKAIAHLAMERKTGARGLRAIMVSFVINFIALIHTMHLFCIKLLFHFFEDLLLGCRFSVLVTRGTSSMQLLCARPG